MNVYVLMLGLGCSETKISDTGTLENSFDDTASDTGVEDTAEDSGQQDTAQEPSNEPDIEDSGVEECVVETETALDWFDDTDFLELSGEISFGQTHVIDEEESRLAPRLVAQRATAIFFTPQESIDTQADVRISGWKEGALIGVLSMKSPQEPIPVLEQMLTEELLEPWSNEAWSVELPYFWLDSDVELRIGYVQDEELYIRDVAFGALAAPHVFTISRAKIVLFGEEDFDTTTVANTKLSQDYFATLPIAELQWVDSTDWILGEIVVYGSDGPVLVSSEGERIEQTTDPDRWNILKHIFTFRMNLANVGLGTINTDFGGQSSPFSFGTSVGLGWVKEDDGTYVDINNAPYSAGWTGWTSIWHGECGNVFNHEVGHSLTLAHFTQGSAQNWNIADEYPNDGVNLATHPWGFDTTRMMFRTWYRVNRDGVVYQDNGSIQGKRDSMNGGEASNSMTCFPQYTGYHAQKAQNWMNQTPTIREENSSLGYYIWNIEQQQYEQDSSNDRLAVESVGVPVMTVIGSLGSESSTSHLYPPMFWASGNSFVLPSPSESGWDAFDGASYVVRVHFADGSIQDVLINRTVITDDSLSLFSFQIPLSKEPTNMELLRSGSSYPNWDAQNTELLHSRSVVIPSTLPEVVRTGMGAQSNGTIAIHERCEEEVNCTDRQAVSTWRTDAQLSFTYGNMELLACTQEEDFSSFSVWVSNEEGVQHEVIVHAQRTIRSDASEISVAMNDANVWSERIGLEQGIRLWVPWEENAQIPVGVWSTQNEHISIWKDGAFWQDMPLEISFEALDVETVDVSVGVYESGALMPDPSHPSSLYFVVTDEQVGPTSGVWWGGNEPSMLVVPVVDSAGSQETLLVQAWRQTCNQGWGTLWQLNAAQVADETCTYQVRLEVDPNDNPSLFSGETYQTRDSQPIIFEGRYWHGPVSRGLAGRFPLQLVYTKP